MAQAWHGRVFLVVIACAIGLHAEHAAYDPLAVLDRFAPKALDIIVEDPERQREIPVRVYLPSEASAAPVVLFSHGLGGSREGGTYLGRHWAARGYVGVFLQHPGSDVSVWKDTPPAKRMTAMRDAADLENFQLRVRDVPAVLDQLERWNRIDGHPLSRRLDMMHVGMSGHSFGAVTTQAVSGQTFGATASYTDVRIKAAIMFSPSSPRRSGETARAFGAVRIPWSLMTGTEDIAPIGDMDVQSRLAVYPALPDGGKYELVLDGAKHSAFADQGRPGESERRNPNHHRVILALTTAFWDAYLRQDAAAKSWLDGDGPKSVLEQGDRWRRK